MIFYSDNMGLEVIENHGGYAELRANERMKLSLFDRKAMEEALPMVHASAVNGHRSVLEFNVDALDEFCGTLRTKGVVFVSDPTDRPDWGIRTAYIQDLDGNLISLYQSLG
ncbi:MAG TPA: VOC family protein [Ktedonobacteraceae bacterium]|nr:VOC family protein [Ktedonobacteraceae bacterium]